MSLHSHAYAYYIFRDKIPDTLGFSFLRKPCPHFASTTPSGYVMDSSEKQVVVTVIDNGDGTLAAEIDEGKLDTPHNLYSFSTVTSI